MPRTVRLAGPAFRLVAGHSEGDRSHAPAWERGRDAPASPGWHRPLAGRRSFFSCPKKRTKRKGSPVAETTPADGLRNRRGKNSLRSNSLPLSPGSAPRRPAQRQRAVFFPRNTPCPAPPSLAGPAFLFATGDSEGDRSHAPAWERRPGRSSVRLCCRQPTTAPTTIAGMARS